MRRNGAKTRHREVAEWTIVARVGRHASRAVTQLPHVPLGTERAVSVVVGVVRAAWDDGNSCGSRNSIALVFCARDYRDWRNRKVDILAGGLSREGRRIQFPLRGGNICRRRALRAQVGE